MKLLCVLLLVSSVVSEGSYEPSGWRPQGPSFELPQRRPDRQYLPADLEPRNNDPDLSVQGLPAVEQTPQYQVSPVSGLQYVGPNFVRDLKNLDQSYRRSQFRNQQRTYQQITNQRQEYGAPSNFKSASTPSTTPITFTTSAPEQNTTTIQKNNEGTVQITKANVQEISPELLLAPLAQLQSQKQLKAAIILQPNSKVNQKLINPFNGAQFAQIQFAAQDQTPQLIPLIINQKQTLPQGVIILPNGQQGLDFNEESVEILPQNRDQQSNPRVEGVDPKADNVNDDDDDTKKYATQFNQPQNNNAAIPQQQFYQQQNLQPAYQPAFLQFNQQPAQLFQQPNQVYQQPAQFNQQPAQSNQQPAQFYQQPAQFNQQPTQFDQKPSQFNQQPARFNQQPSQFNQQPSQFNQQPAQFYPQPAQFYQQPAQFDQQPAQFYQQPAQFDQQPAQFNQQPAQQYQPHLAQITTDDLYNYYVNQQQFLQQQQLLQQELLQHQLNAQAAQNQNRQPGPDVKQGDDDDKDQDDGGVTATAVAVSFGGRPANEYGAPDFRTTNQYPTSEKPSTPQNTADEVTDTTSGRQNARFFARRFR